MQAGCLNRALQMEYLKKKKKIPCCYLLHNSCVSFFTLQWNGTAEGMYWICAGLGFGTGFWAIFVTMGAEQFGTNLRATAATTIPNMVRGMLTVLILPLFKGLRGFTDYYTGGWMAAIIIMIITIIAAKYTRETFGKDLNFIEK